MQCQQNNVTDSDPPELQANIFHPEMVQKNVQMQTKQRNGLLSIGFQTRFPYPIWLYKSGMSTHMLGLNGTCETASFQESWQPSLLQSKNYVTSSPV